MSEKCLVTEQKKTIHDTHVYIRGSITEFEDYDDLINRLHKLTTEDNLTIHLNTPGGDCSVGFFLIDEILAVPCPITMIVEYPTYSMGAIMALCGDQLVLNPNTYLMFHDYSGGTAGKGEETYLYSTNYRKVFKDKFTRLCKPFLSPAEINKMFKGEDIYIHDDDPTLKTRCSRHFK